MELTIDQALQKGIEAHKAGQIQEADRLYTAIIEVQPKHPNANHNLGILAVSVGKVQDALPFLKVALDANPNTAQFWLSYIDALIKLERLTDAKVLLDQARSNGAKGERFDELKQRLDGVEPAGTTVSKTQEPPQNQLQSLVNIYDQGKFQHALSKASKLLQKFPKSVVLLNIIGVSNKGLGQLNEAVEAFEKAIAIGPGYADAYNNMGTTLQDQGKREEAIEAYNKALAIKPDYAEAYYNLGNTLQDQGKLEGSIEAYNKALVFRPDYGDAYCNIGNAFQEQGELDEALEAYKKALFHKYDFAKAYCNMGNVLKDQGKLDEALEAYTRALSHKYDFAEAYCNMGVTLNDQGKPEEAIAVYNKALSLKPDYPEAYYNLGNTLQGVVFNKPNSDLQMAIITILGHKTYVRPKDISPAAISLLKFEASLQQYLQAPSLDKVRQSPLTVIEDLSNLPLLTKLMRVCPLANIKLENLLKEVRCSLLLSIFSLIGLPEILKFQSTLALQCFINEYIYDQTMREGKALEAIEARVSNALLKGEQPNAYFILCLASYKALHEYEWCDLLANTNDFEEVFNQQIVEPEQEKCLKSNIPALVEITDKVSSKVREQYEKNPYPRWVNLGLPLKPALTSKVISALNLRLFDNTINEVKAPTILIAGCGTGQHSISTATRFKDSKVLAIDLSLSSLAYAKRKTEELGIQNIEYMQADILDLVKINRRFDIVESAGVLHHMEDPMAGWRVLTDCLKPGGLMNIGLYSDLARQHIVDMREEISQAALGSSDLAMKSFRNSVIKSDKEHHNQILNSSDFYSLSTLRDLLFHVQEHRFTLSQIKECLAELCLEFCGFESVKLVQNFKSNNTGPDDPYDLDKWNSYEEANPDLFRAMYQFWCQKVG